MFPNASPLEIARVIAASFGLFLAIVLLVLSVQDEQYRRRRGLNGLVRLDIQQAMVTAAALVVVFIGAVATGLIAATLPPNPTSSPVAVALHVVVHLVLIGLTFYRLRQRVSVWRAIWSAGHGTRPGERPHHSRATDS